MTSQHDIPTYILDAFGAMVESDRHLIELKRTNASSGDYQLAIADRNKARAKFDRLLEEFE